MSFAKLISAIFFTLLLAGCLSEERYDGMIQSLLSDDIKSLSNQATELIIAKDYPAIIAHLHDGLLTEDIEDRLVNTLNYIPEGQLIERKIAGYNISTLKTLRGIDRTTHTLLYQYHFTDGWMLLRLIFQAENNEIKISNLNIEIISDDLKEIHKFDIGSASIKDITFLLALTLIPLFIIFTFTQAFRIRKTLLKPKRWLFFILIGFGALSLNWTTDVITMQVLSFGLLGAGGSSAGPYAPWLFTIYFPLGALLFWGFRKTGKLGLKDNPVDAVNSPAE